MKGTLSETDHLAAPDAAEKLRRNAKTARWWAKPLAGAGRSHLDVRQFLNESADLEEDAAAEIDELQKAARAAKATDDGYKLPWEVFEQLSEIVRQKSGGLPRHMCNDVVTDLCIGLDAAGFDIGFKPPEKMERPPLYVGEEDTP